ncbi:MAG: CopG family transcriptional regulator [Nitrospirae bacterium RBG_16_64_22]|nr:MAG: CopG family transcriptional regulator [Nitrospirae bacterium RBG_16_64_22]
MVRTQIYLTEREQKALRSMSSLTGKSRSELIREALDTMIGRLETTERLVLMRRGRGIWKGRRDLPDVRKLRLEFERSM